MLLGNVFCGIVLLSQGSKIVTSSTIKSGQDFFLSFFNVMGRALITYSGAQREWAEGEGLFFGRNKVSEKKNRRPVKRERARQVPPSTFKFLEFS